MGFFVHLSMPETSKLWSFPEYPKTNARMRFSDHPATKLNDPRWQQLKEKARLKE